MTDIKKCVKLLLVASANVPNVRLCPTGDRMNQDEKLIKLAVVANSLGVSQRTIRRWVVEKKMPAYKPGRSYLFHWSEVRIWMKRCNDEGSDDDSRGGNAA